MDSVNWVNTHAALVSQWTAEYKASQDEWVQKYKGIMSVDAEAKEAVRRRRDHSKKTLDKLKAMREGSELPSPPVSEAKSQAMDVDASVSTPNANSGQNSTHEGAPERTPEESPLPTNETQKNAANALIGSPIVEGGAVPVDRGLEGDASIDGPLGAKNPLTPISDSVLDSATRAENDVDMVADKGAPTAEQPIFNFFQGSSQPITNDFAMNVDPQVSTVMQNTVPGGSGHATGHNLFSWGNTAFNHNMSQSAVGPGALEGTGMVQFAQQEFGRDFDPMNWGNGLQFNLDMFQIDSKPHDKRTKEEILRYVFIYQPIDRSIFDSSAAAQMEQGEEPKAWLARREHLFFQQALEDAIFQKETLQKAILAIQYNQGDGPREERLDSDVAQAKRDELHRNDAEMNKTIEDLKRQENAALRTLTKLHPIHSDIGLMSLDDLRRLRDTLTEQIVAGTVANFSHLQTRVTLVKTQISLLEATNSRKGTTKKDVNAHKCKWVTNPEERSEMISVAYDLVDAYKEAIKGGDSKEIEEALNKFDPTTLRCAREVQCFCPSIVTISKELTLRVLTSGDKLPTVKCRYHHIHRGQSASKPDQPDKHNGSAYERNLEGPAMEHHCHCGCFQNHACWDLIWFKFGSAISTNPTLAFTRHYLRDTECLDPRWRAIIVFIMEQLLGRDLDQLYAENYFLNRFPVQHVAEDAFGRGKQ